MLYFKFNSKSVCLEHHVRKKSLWRTFVDKFCKKLLANPDFDDKLRCVALWYLEYSEEYDGSCREIGLDSNKNVIVKMPDERNYGYWLDTNCTIEDFEKESGFQIITEQEFNNLWYSVDYDKETEKFKPARQ